MSSDITIVETGESRIVVIKRGAEVTVSFSFTKEDLVSGAVDGFFKALSEQVKEGFVSLRFPEVTNDIEVEPPETAPDPSRLN
jgi:hypothetical protein